MAGWYVKRGEKVTGPIKTDNLKEFVANGQLLPSDQLAKDASGPWTTAGKTKLFAEVQTPAVAIDQVAEGAGESSNRFLWAFASVAVLAVVSLVGYLILSEGEPGPTAAEVAVAEPVAPPPATAEPTEQPGKRFEYKVLSEEWNKYFGGKAVTVEAEVPDDVAPKITKADLESLVPALIEKYGGAPFKILFHTETPLMNAWGVINYNPGTTVGKEIDCQILDYAFEMGPWYFPDKIDRKTKWHEMVWITLPMANKIVNGATQFHWEVTRRSANDVYFDSEERPLGAMKDTMRLSPQTWEICTYDGDVPRFVRLVESSLNHLDHDLSQNIVGKLNSVIGSQEYLHGDETNWTWMIGRREVTYFHYKGSDTVTIMQTTPD